MAWSTITQADAVAVLVRTGGKMVTLTVVFLILLSWPSLATWGASWCQGVWSRRAEERESWRVIDASPRLSLGVSFIATLCDLLFGHPSGNLGDNAESWRETVEDMGSKWRDTI